MDQKILAVETSGRACSLALAERTADRTTTRCEILFDMGPRHSEILKDACVFALRKCGWNKEGLDLCAVSVGPGSFTGLRVGIAFTRALAGALRIPLAGVTSFEILAESRRAQSSGTEGIGLVAVLLDSISGQVCAGLFKPGALRPASPYSVLKIPELCSRLGRYRAVEFVGDGFLRHRREIEKRLGPGRVRAPALPAVLKASDLARIARPPAGKKIRAPVLPLYLRPPMAVERMAR